MTEQTERTARDNALFWLRRIGIILAIAAAGAIFFYAVGLLLDLFAHDTQVIIGMALSVLTVAAVVWWAASALMDALEEIRSTRDDIDELRAEGSSLVSYARELLVLSQEQLELLYEMLDLDPSDETDTDEMPAATAEQRAATQVMKAVRRAAGTLSERTDTVEARQAITPQAVAGEDEDVEEWARHQVAAMWGKHAVTVQAVSVQVDSATPAFIEPTVDRPTPAKRTGSTAANKEASEAASEKDAP